MDVVVCLYNIDSPCLGPVSFLVMMLMMISFHLNVLDLAFFSWLLVNLLNGLLLTNCWHSICKIFPVRHTLINWCDRETALTLSKIFFDTTLLPCFSVSFKGTTAFTTIMVPFTDILCLRCMLLVLFTAASFSLLYISKFKYGVFIYSQLCRSWMAWNSSFWRLVYLELPHIFLHTWANSYLLLQWN